MVAILCAGKFLFKIAEECSGACPCLSPSRVMDTLKRQLVWENLRAMMTAKDNSVELVDRTLKARERVIAMLKFYLKAAQDKMKAYADKKRSDKEFAVGDLLKYIQSSMYLSSKNAIPLICLWEVCHFSSEGSLAVIPYKILDRKLAKQGNRVVIYGMI
ncbi:hypothetical protein Tco_0704766 [Tanacetum coccineum]|uniref:Uncharacterized protein n=1 Tax=Tanacetum coccineum TaxID=301880 RepID=A0ABQ4Y2L7_9ASTR